MRELVCHARRLGEIAVGRILLTRFAHNAHVLMCKACACSSTEWVWHGPWLQACERVDIGPLQHIVFFVSKVERKETINRRVFLKSAPLIKFVFLKKSLKSSYLQNSFSYQLQLTKLFLYQIQLKYQTTITLDSDGIREQSNCRWNDLEEIFSIIVYLFTIPYKSNVTTPNDWVFRSTYSLSQIELGDN